jgi:hypothetical protein
LIAAVAVAAASAFAQDNGPVLQPKKVPPKPPSAPPKSAPSPAILVVCDLACNWTLDGGDQVGSLAAGESKKVQVPLLGQHRLDATTQDNLDKIKPLQFEIKTPTQIEEDINLQPVRDARLKAEQDALAKANQSPLSVPVPNPTVVATGTAPTPTTSSAQPRNRQPAASGSGSTPTTSNTQPRNTPEVASGPVSPPPAPSTQPHNTPAQSSGANTTQAKTETKPRPGDIGSIHTQPAPASPPLDLQSSGLAGARAVTVNGAMVLPLATGKFANINKAQTIKGVKVIEVDGQKLLYRSGGEAAPVEKGDYLEDALLVGFGTFKGQDALTFPAGSYCTSLVGGVNSCGDGLIYITAESVAFVTDKGKSEFVSNRSATTVKNEGGAGDSYSIYDDQHKRHRFGMPAPPVDEVVGGPKFGSPYVTFLQAAIASFPQAYAAVQRLAAGQQAEQAANEAQAGAYTK